MQSEAEANTARTWLAGCFLSHLTRDEVLDAVRGWIDGKRKGQYICAINVSKLVAAQRDPKLRDFLRDSDINIADGAPIVTAARLVGNPIPERVTGVELMEELFRLANTHRFRLFFFGSKQSVLDKVVARCREDYPELVVAGARNGYFSPDEEPAIVDEIAAAKADILLVALGVPQKEYFVHDNNARLDVSLALPVGGAFDVFAGEKVRAPGWVQRFGVEWLWRSVYDGSRARMVFRSMFPFMKIVMGEVARQRFGTGKKVEC